MRQLRPFLHPSFIRIATSWLDFASFARPFLPFLEGSYREECQEEGLQLHLHRSLEAFKEASKEHLHPGKAGDYLMANQPQRLLRMATHQVVDQAAHHSYRTSYWSFAANSAACPSSWGPKIYQEGSLRILSANLRCPSGFHGPTPNWTLHR